MTEEEAKTKWCPFAKPPTEIPRSVTEHVSARCDATDGDHIRTMNCIGSACMAWRESGRIKPFKVDKSVKAHWEKHGYTVEPDTLPDVFIVTKISSSGYCGLAGEP